MELKLIEGALRMKRKCQHCHYEWRSRHIKPKPKQCPRCKRYGWERGQQAA